jgi:hypothetical protein
MSGIEKKVNKKPKATATMNSVGVIVNAVIALVLGIYSWGPYRRQPV